MCRSKICIDSAFSLNVNTVQGLIFAQGEIFLDQHINAKNL